MTPPSPAQRDILAAVDGCARHAAARVDRVQLQAVALPSVDTFRNQILECSAETLLRSVPANSIDLIFTDPPYSRQFLPCYGQLAEGADRALKPGGFVLAMAGGLYADKILELMSAHLTYYWTFHVYLPGKDAAAVHPMGNHAPVITRVKPIYAFVKGKGSPRTVIHEPYVGGGNDKRFHHWEQDLKSARYFIDCFSRPGDWVVDPFCGSGGYALVCRALGRAYTGCDIDPQSVFTARSRLSNPYYTPSKGEQMVLKFAEAAR